MPYTATTLLEARASIETANNGGMNRNELRMPNFGAFRAHLDNTSELVPGLNILQLKKSSNQAVKIPVYQRGAQGTGTVRKCAGSGGGTTALKTVVFETFVEEFSMSTLEFKDNQFDYDRVFARQLAERMRSVYTRLEQRSVANLEANKSTVNAGGIYPAIAGGAKPVPYDTKYGYDLFFANLSAEMMSNDYTGNLDFVASPNLIAPYNFIAQQGSNNGNNLAYQLAGYDPYWSRFIAPGAGNYGTAYVFNPGTIGVLPWSNQLHRDGEDIRTDEWTIYDDPIMGIRWELKIKRQCQDNSATLGPGYEADLVESFVISGEFAWLTAYSSTADTGIYRYDLKVA